MAEPQTLPGSPLKQSMMSPLKQVNGPVKKLKPKIQTEWEVLASDPHKFDDVAPGRYFADLFCLAADTHIAVVVDAIKALSADLDTMERFRTTISLIFIHAIKYIKDAPVDDVRRQNAVHTLIPFIFILVNRYRLLIREDVASVDEQIQLLLSGGDVDAVFYDLVAGLNATLSNADVPFPLRQKTLLLTLIVVSSAFGGPILSYFFKRDLFGTLVRFMNDVYASALAEIDEIEQKIKKKQLEFNHAPNTPSLVALSAPPPVTTAREDARGGDAPPRPATAPMFEHAVQLAKTIVSNAHQVLRDAALVLSLLSHFYRANATNPYLVRMQDLVDESTMHYILLLARHTADEAVQQYADVQDDSPGALAAIASLLRALGPRRAPPPSPVPALSAASWGPLHQGAPADAVFESLLGGTVAAFRAAHGPLPAAPAPAPTPEPFAHMPPAAAAVLLPLFDVMNSNDVFLSILFAPATVDTSLPPALISLGSYVLTHAAVGGVRSATYARLVLNLFAIVVEKDAEQARPSLYDSVAVRLCRQRTPPPTAAESRPLLTSLLDTTRLFLQHSMHADIDVEATILSIRFAQQIMQRLKSDRVRLSYAWDALWEAVLALGGLVVERNVALRARSPNVDQLIARIFTLVSYAIYWGGTIFESDAVVVDLQCALLGAQATLTQLSTLLGIPPGAHTTEKRSTVDEGRVSTSRSVPGTPLLSSGGSHAGYVASGCVSNLDLLISALNAKIAEEQERIKAESLTSPFAGVMALFSSGSDELTPEQTRAIVRQHGLPFKFVSCPALDDLVPLSEDEQVQHLTYFVKHDTEHLQTLINVISHDCLVLSSTVIY